MEFSAVNYACEDAGNGKSHYTETQIVGILKGVGGGSLVKDVCREYGVSGAIYYNWISKYGGKETLEVKRLK